MADRYSTDRPQKKRKHNYQSDHHQARPQQQSDPRARQQDNLLETKPQLSYGEALEKLPPVTSELDDVPSYTHFTVPSNGLPPLPEVKDGHLSIAPFRHKSAVAYNRSTSSSQPDNVTYEKLEFLGDAQLELIASRLIYQRFSHLLAGQQSQLRELLVKNETLSEYARAYGFEKRVQVGDLESMLQDSKDRGNKGFNKVLGDVFEAYIAAVVLSDHENGFAVVEKWMTTLWAPKLHEAAQIDRFYTRDLSLSTDKDADPLKVYNPAAKAELQKRIAGRDVKLDYEPYRATVELKGHQLGQNKHFIALYLTGYGHTRKLLGKGEGKNKVEAGNVAATEAMYGECKLLVEECEKVLSEIRAQKKAEKEAKDAVAREASQV